MSYKDILNRLTDKTTLLLLGSLVVGLLVNLGAIDAVAVQKHTDTINIIVGILCAVGIVRDPAPVPEPDSDEQNTIIE
ncbi:hypothetical protein [Thermoactinomyces sp. DSM 45892]|uniref:hypothetical protein n=1 Tax=Thermoactinomyces sp. DSM 45892 TaxID=1882753 RepID=UPI000897AEA5|nr:hypothetical protein [Thermoactinomyces sp. DSM 45892]SDZ05421.1 hypothetical protein SAMN05444416_11294 [Thermoactinomyces sp. DSM 45892]